MAPQISALQKPVSVCVYCGSRHGNKSAYTAAGLPPTVQIELNAKLLHTPSQRVAASRTFLQQTPTASVAIEDVVAAFDKGLHALTGDIVGWVLTSGNQDAKRRTD